jgi:hypothetical protein
VFAGARNSPTSLRSDASDKNAKERMRDPVRLPLGRIAILVIIAGAHVFLVEILSRRHVMRTAGMEEERGLLFFVDLPRWVPDDDLSLEQEPTTPRKAAATPRSAQPAPAQPITPPANTAIDWYKQAEIVARADLDASGDPKPRAFGEQPVSPYRKKKRKPPIVWEPEEKKAGFAGPFPFVRLGKKCVLMPPFFSCSFGKEKKFEGYTLDDMRDPDRPRSSVPDPRE